MAADAQMGVDGTHVFEDRRISGESSAGAGTDLFDFRRDTSRASTVLCIYRLVDRGGEKGGHFVDTRGAFRAQIYLGARFAGNRVDARSAFDQSEIERRSGARGGNAVGEQSDGAGQRMDGIADAVIGPGMAAGSGDGDVETAAGEGLGGDAVGAGAVEHQKSFDTRGGTGTAQITHAGEISFALLADVGDQDGRERRIVQRLCGLPGGGDRE